MLDTFSTLLPLESLNGIFQKHFEIVKISRKKADEIWSNLHKPDQSLNTLSATLMGLTSLNIILKKSFKVLIRSQ